MSFLFIFFYPRRLSSGFLDFQATHIILNADRTGLIFFKKKNLFFSSFSSFFTLICLAKKKKPTLMNGV